MTGHSSWERWLSRLEEQLDLDALMKGCGRAILDLTGADRCSIMVLESDTEELVVRWAQGLRVRPSGRRLRFRVGEGLAGWVARSQKSFCSTDATREPRFVPCPPAVWRASQRRGRFRSVRSICCIPLVCRNQTVGVVNLTSFSPERRFRTRQPACRRLMNRLAQWLAQTLSWREAEAVSQRLRRQMKATFEAVAQVSHEVRTPLTLITEGTQQLLDGLVGPLTPDQEKRVGFIRSQADRMLRLVSELLDLSRIEAGRLVLRRRALDLAEVIQDVCRRYEPLVLPRRLSLEMEEAAPVYGDPTRVAQVVENLLTNAVKFTPPDGTITLHLAARGRWAELAIADTGVGILPREQHRLFQRFAALRTPAALGSRGIGLGLAIVKEIVQLHGGTVRVDSRPGRGTAFTVSLPLYTAAFALAEEFRVMREQAARQGQLLAVQWMGARPATGPGACLPAGRGRGADRWDAAEFLQVVGKHVAREDQLLPAPEGGAVLLSVLDAAGFASLRKRLRQVLEDHPDLLPTTGLAWGWGWVPQEGTELAELLPLVKERAG